MKAVARSYFWYPGLDQEIEKKAQSCTSCQAVKNAPPAAPLHPWLWPTKPWQRIHVDFAGPFQGKTYLLVLDAHSKWPEIVEMNSTTSQRTIAELCKTFAAHGLPQQLVSDNGPQFISDEFATFMKSNGIKHIRCAPYHPASNGAVERLVQTFKKAMKTSTDTSFALASFCCLTAQLHIALLMKLLVSCFWDETYVPGWIYSYQTVKRQSLNDKQIRKQGTINIHNHVNLP